ncbi:mannose-6-phosphate isomerase, class I [Herbiconiux sp. KACC 21604]|uniref:mannose-6-phosphate isomerase, class I n=1 Tax=unclassified Herbiconiux TaxID=2618217 RepID=UPI001492146C|nr:mannose-6-phosphate isomerase, class I [Herbiconiux sp. SALV-R1]QJU54409.1 mannose-6-phosphate isomerase, class I [Herbiconiux sp. SALV-R1]WPO85482.1 mannose-6-phosphate isomerase, class I [Herbiconiux sp. KACC 21604]
MFVPIANTPRPYAWGSVTDIPELLGTPVTGEPQAELWLGAHPGSPSRILDPQLTGGAHDLAEWIAADPTRVVGRDGSLPFLLKILAAAAPLSLQAHPTLERAREGFRRENEQGVPLDAPNRNYKDPLHKPELVVALSDRYEALCGFRPLEEVREIVDLLVRIDNAQTAPRWELYGPIVHLLEDSVTLTETDAEVLRSVVAWLLDGGEAVEALVGHLVRTAEKALHPAHAHLTDPYTPSLETVVRLNEEYPGDPGVVISLLLNRVTLKKGEALFLPAGNIHAYLSGLGVELMSASDNVLRGGLTPKYIDVPELLEVLDFDPLPVPFLEASSPEPGLQLFTPSVPDFVLARIEPGVAADAPATVDYTPLGAAIAICLSGSVTLSGASGSHTLVRGDSVFITPDEGALSAAGTGTVFLAAPGAPAHELP